jgi:hypothetical protein
MRKNEMHGLCGRYREVKTCINGVGGENSSKKKKKKQLKCPEVNEKQKLKQILMNTNGGNRLA